MPRSAHHTPKCIFVSLHYSIQSVAEHSEDTGASYTLERHPASSDQGSPRVLDGPAGNHGAVRGTGHSRAGWGGDRWELPWEQKRIPFL